MNSYDPVSPEVIAALRRSLSINSVSPPHWLMRISVIATDVAGDEWRGTLLMQRVCELVARYDPHRYCGEAEAQQALEQIQLMDLAKETAA